MNAIKWITDNSLVPSPEEVLFDVLPIFMQYKGCKIYNEHISYYCMARLASHIAKNVGQTINGENSFIKGVVSSALRIIGVKYKNLAKGKWEFPKFFEIPNPPIKVERETYKHAFMNLYNSLTIGMELQDIYYIFFATFDADLICTFPSLCFPLSTLKDIELAEQLSANYLGNIIKPLMEGSVQPEEIKGYCEITMSGIAALLDARKVNFREVIVMSEPICFINFKEEFIRNLSLFYNASPVRDTFQKPQEATKFLQDQDPVNIGLNVQLFLSCYDSISRLLSKMNEISSPTYWQCTKLIISSLPNYFVQNTGVKTLETKPPSSTVSIAPRNNNDSLKQRFANQITKVPISNNNSNSKLQDDYTQWVEKRREQDEQQKPPQKMSFDLQPFQIKVQADPVMIQMMQQHVAQPIQQPIYKDTDSLMVNTSLPRAYGQMMGQGYMHVIEQRYGLVPPASQAPQPVVPQVQEKPKVEEPKKDLKRKKLDQIEKFDVSKDVEADTPNEECLHCQERKKQVIALPCAHQILCIECIKEHSDVYASRDCPTCRQPIKKFIVPF